MLFQVNVELKVKTVTDALNFKRRFTMNRFQLLKSGIVNSVFSLGILSGYYFFDEQF